MKNILMICVLFTIVSSSSVLGQCISESSMKLKVQQESLNDSYREFDKYLKDEERRVNDYNQAVEKELQNHTTFQILSWILIIGFILYIYYSSNKWYYKLLVGFLFLMTFTALSWVLL